MQERQRGVAAATADPGGTHCQPPKIRWPEQANTTHARQESGTDETRNGQAPHTDGQGANGG